MAPPTLPPGKLTYQHLRTFPRAAGEIPVGLKCQCCGSRAVTVRDISGAGAADPVAIACMEEACGRTVTGPNLEKAAWFFNRPLMSESALEAESLRHAGLTLERDTRWRR